MAISLSKGQKVDLTKGKPSLKKLMVGLGWDVNAFDGADFDLDASAFINGFEPKSKFNFTVCEITDEVKEASPIKNIDELVEGLENPEDESIEEIYRKLDSDNNGDIDFVEFKKYVKEIIFKILEQM